MEIMTKQKMIDLVNNKISLQEFENLKEKAYTLEIYTDGDVSLNLRWSASKNAFLFLIYRQNIVPNKYEQAIIGGEYAVSSDGILQDISKHMEDIYTDLVDHWNFFNGYYDCMICDRKSIAIDCYQRFSAEKRYLWGMSMHDTSHAEDEELPF